MAYHVLKRKDAVLLPFRIGFQVTIHTDSVNPVEWFRELKRRWRLRRHLRSFFQTDPNWPGVGVGASGALGVTMDGHVYRPLQLSPERSPEVWSFVGYIPWTSRDRPPDLLFGDKPFETQTLWGESVRIYPLLACPGYPEGQLDLRPEYLHYPAPRLGRFYTADDVVLVAQSLDDRDGYFRGVVLRPVRVLPRVCDTPRHMALQVSLGASGLKRLDMLDGPLPSGTTRILADTFNPHTFEITP